MKKKPSRKTQKKNPASLDPKASYRELQLRLDRKFGPQAINGPVTDAQLKNIAKILKAGQPLYGLYSRWSEDDIRRIAEEVVGRTQSIIEERLTESRADKLVDLCVNFGLGIMGAAVWDIFKILLPHIQNLFAAAEPTENMKRIAAWEAEVQSLAPSEMRNFADDNLVALRALRAETWRKLQKSIEGTELGSVLGELIIRDLMEAYEHRLFPVGRV